MGSRFIPWADGRGGVTVFGTEVPDFVIAPKPVHQMTTRDLDCAMAAAPTAMDASILEERWGKFFDAREGT